MFFLVTQKATILVTNLETLNVISPFHNVDLGIAVISVYSKIRIAQHWGRRGAHLSESKGVKM